MDFYTRIQHYNLFYLKSLGIGYETAKNLAKRGAKVYIPCRNVEIGEIIAGKYKERKASVNLYIHLRNKNFFFTHRKN